MLTIAGQLNKPHRVTLMTFAVMVLSGCESLPGLSQGFPDFGQTAAPTVSDRRTGRTGEEAHELRRAIDLLQDGRLRSGRAALVTFLKRNPANQTALSLLRQIDTDPATLLGEEHTLYTVQPGDTLGELSDRLLGDAVSFLALARFNNIQTPRVLHVGQTLRIPVARVHGAEPAVPEDPVEALVKPAMAPAVALESAAEPGQASTQVDTSTASGERATSDIETTAIAIEAAEIAVDDIKPSLGSAAPVTRATTAPVIDHARIAQYHQDAVAHFRNQELEEAIALWDRVLALDPGFEPALGYRKRAQELKRRLEALETL